VVPEDRRPSNEELAAENAALRGMVSDLLDMVEMLRAEVIDLKR
jgi:hypothetical protein